MKLQTRTTTRKKGVNLSERHRLGRGGACQRLKSNFGGIEGLTWQNHLSKAEKRKIPPQGGRDESGRVRAKHKTIGDVEPG